MNGSDRRKLTLITIRNQIKLARRWDRGFDTPQIHAMQVGLLNFFDYLFDQTSLKEMKDWFQVQALVYADDVDILLSWANRKTVDKGGWPPGKTALKRMIRLYTLSVIVGHTVKSMNDLDPTVLWGIQQMYKPSDGHTASYAGEFYLFCRGLIHGGSALMLELTTVQAL